MSVLTIIKGTSNRNRGQLENELAAIGGNIQAEAGRETTKYTLTVFKDQVGKAVEILGDVLSNSVYDKNQVEAEREAVYRDNIEVQKDQLEATWEAVHYTVRTLSKFALVFALYFLLSSVMKELLS